MKRKELGSTATALYATHDYLSNYEVGAVEVENILRSIEPRNFKAAFEDNSLEDDRVVIELNLE